MRSDLVIIVILVSVLTTGLAWFAFHPKDLARVAGWVWPVKPVVRTLTLSLNDEARIIRPGQFIRFHPQDTLAVVSFTSNHWLNYDLRLDSPDLDLELLSKPVALMKLLGEKGFTKPRQFVIQVKAGPKVIADFYLLASMTALDWAAKADREKSKEQKIHYYRLALELEPKNFRLRNKLVALLEETGKYRAAAELLDQALGKKTDLKILKRILSIHRAGGGQAKVVQTYRRLIAASPEKAARSYLRELARLHEDRGEIKKAVQVYEALRARLPLNQTAGALKKIGFLQAKINNIGQAIKAYEAAALIDEKDANIFFNLARLYQSKDNQAKYLEHIAKALSLDPSDVQAHMELINTYLQAGQSGRAEEELKALIAKDPDNMEARLRLAELLEQGADREQLAEQYEYLLTKDPENKVLRYNLGVIHYDAGRLEQAEAMMKEVVRLDPRDVEAVQYLFEVYRRQKKDKPALAQAEELVRLKPELDAPYGYIFDYLCRKEDYKSLVQKSRAWIKGRPAAIKLSEYLAYAQIKMNRLGPAAQTYEAIAEMKPGDVENLMKLARIYEGLGRLKEARDVYKRVLKIDPDNGQAAEGHLRLSMEVLKSKHGE